MRAPETDGRRLAINSFSLSETRVRAAVASEADSSFSDPYVTLMAGFHVPGGARGFDFSPSHRGVLRGRSPADAASRHPKQ